MVGSLSLFPFCFNSYLCPHALLQEKMELEVEANLRRRYGGEIADIEIVEKEDLDLVSCYNTLPICQTYNFTC